jgi:hypothetical protein
MASATAGSCVGAVVPVPFNTNRKETNNDESNAQ